MFLLSLFKSNVFVSDRCKCCRLRLHRQKEQWNAKVGNTPSVFRGLTAGVRGRTAGRAKSFVRSWRQGVKNSLQSLCYSIVSELTSASFYDFPLHSVPALHLMSVWTKKHLVLAQNHGRSVAFFSVLFLQLCEQFNFISSRGKQILVISYNAIKSLATFNALPEALSLCTRHLTSGL